MKHQAEGLKAYGVWGFAFTPSTTAFGLPAMQLIQAKPQRGASQQTTTNAPRVLKTAFDSAAIA